MKIVPIFETENVDREHYVLWAVIFDGEEKDEYHRLLDAWADPEYVRTFMKENEPTVLGNFWKFQSMSSAVFEVFDQADCFEEDLLKVHDLCISGKDCNQSINEIFTPYHYEIAPTKLKGKPVGVLPSLLRLYALQLEDGQIIIFGGGIKLTRTVQESPHLMVELAKAKRVKDYLKSKGIQFLD